MNENDKKNMYRLFREHDDAVGSSKATVIALEAFSRSIRDLKTDQADIKTRIMDLCDAIKVSEPRIVPLIRMITAFEKEMEPHFHKSVEKIKTVAAYLLMDKIDQYNEAISKVTENGLAYIKDNDTIIVHTASTGVINMFVRAKTEFNKNYKALVLKQDILKTRQLITALGDAGVDFTVVPEYDLSHVVKSADKMIMGGLTVTSDKKIVTAIGSANVVSLCHLNKVPVYLFINTFKFSNFPSTEQRIHMKKATVSKGDYSFQLTTHSHDLVDFGLIDKLVTEYGEKNLEELQGQILDQES